MNKTLQCYLDAVAALVVDAQIVDPSCLINDVTNDSRSVGRGFIFVAIKGAKADGHRFIQAAVNAGAAAVICSDPKAFVPGVNCVAVRDDYVAYALLAECHFGRPADRMAMVGITGTNGKTTTAYLLHRMITACGGRCGLISTVKYQYGKLEIAASRTTPEAYELQHLFALMANHDCRYAVMEVSSHGLDQRRTANTRFAVSIFSNLTGDHLDYHETMENYYQAKKALFSELTSGVAVINADDPYGHRLAGELSGVKVVTYGQNAGCDYRIESMTLSARESVYVLNINGHAMVIHSSLPGEHNVYNLTSAIAAADALGLDRETSISAVAGDFKVPGRLEFYPTPSGASVYIDYAHTDDALRRVIDALRPICRKRLTVVFGCGGDRDKTKRPRMGKAAAAGDRVIITSDNPRSEDPAVIINDILPGLPPGCDHVVEPDRRKALRLALAGAADGDIILVAGKGHETYQEINGTFHDFSDAAVIRECLENP